MRTTVTLNDAIARQLKLRAADSDMSVSELIEDAVKYQLLEDYEDIEDAQKRSNEPTYLFDNLVKEFKSEGLL